MILLEQELLEIQKLIDNDDYDNGISRFQQLIDSMIQSSDPSLPMVCYEFGMLLFDLGDYSSSLPYLINAYSNHYEKQTILTFLYESFINPNQEEFKDSYGKQLEELKAMIHYSSIPKYEELTIDFIPVSDHEYYLFDHKKLVFYGNIVYALNQGNLESIELADEFSDLTLSGEWNLYTYHPYITAAAERNVYLISDDALKTLSFLKIPQFATRFIINVHLFDSFQNYKEYLHTNPSCYLPRLHYGKNPLFSKEISDFFNQEHEYRISSEGRNTNNLLLSICIPTWNRGHRALDNVKALLKLPYDAEIEIVVSNNGSDHYVNEYQEIKNSKDARIKYWEFETNQGFPVNAAHVVSIASAPFALIISDEDALIDCNLSHYLSLIKQHPSLALVRSSTTHQYNFLNDIYTEAGMPAFRESFLLGNYISGFIYNTSLFNKIDVPNIRKLFDTNPSYNSEDGSYPHMWWNAFLVFLGDYCSDSLPLVNEGKSEMANQTKLLNNYDQVFDTTINGLIRYARIEARIKQHLGFISLLNVLPFPTHLDQAEGYQILCSKTTHLFYIVTNDYLKGGYTLEYLREQLLTCLLEGLIYLRTNQDYISNGDFDEHFARLILRLS